MLWDALRKIIQISAQLCQAHDLTEWRQSHHHLRSIKKNYRLIQTLKHSTSKDEAKREAKQDEIKEAYQVYIDQAQRMVQRARATCQLLKTELKELLDLVVLPKKGRLSEADKIHEYSPEFVQLRRQHSAVESAINALGVHGLDKCPDHGMEGFKRYVALAVVARNIQRLGVLVREQEVKKAARRRGPYQKAA